MGFTKIKVIASSLLLTFILLSSNEALAAGFCRRMVQRITVTGEAKAGLTDKQILRKRSIHVAVPIELIAVSGAVAIVSAFMMDVHRNEKKMESVIARVSVDERKTLAKGGDVAKITEHVTYGDSVYYIVDGYVFKESIQNPNSIQWMGLTDAKRVMIVDGLLFAESAEKGFMARDEDLGFEALVEDVKIRQVLATDAAIYAVSEDGHLYEMKKQTASTPLRLWRRNFSYDGMSAMSFEDTGIKGVKSLIPKKFTVEKTEAKVQLQDGSLRSANGS